MPLDDEHFLNNYNTELSPENMRRYKIWLDQQSKRRGRDVSKDEYNYDMRGYWVNGGYKDTDSTGHFPDTYKKPSHPTFSDQSIYHNTAAPFGENYQGGRWSPDENTYIPSPTMLKYTHSQKSLADYFNKYEKPLGVRLLIDTRKAKK